MNQPAQALTFDQLQGVERQMFDDVATLSSALGYNLIVGFGAQNVEAEDGKVYPSLTLIFHPDKEGEDPRPLTLTCPEAGPNFFGLLTHAAKICAEILNEYQQKCGRASAHFIQAQEVSKVRKKGRSALILPGGRN